MLEGVAWTAPAGEGKGSREGQTEKVIKGASRILNRASLALAEPTTWSPLPVQSSYNLLNLLLTIAA